MPAVIAEVAGILLAVVGCGLIVVAAAMVSTPLAVLTAGVFSLFLGTAMVAAINSRARRS